MRYKRFEPMGFKPMFAIECGIIIGHQKKIIKRKQILLELLFPAGNFVVYVRWETVNDYVAELWQNYSPPLQEKRVRN